MSMVPMETLSLGPLINLFYPSQGGTESDLAAFKIKYEFIF